MSDKKVTTRLEGEVCTCLWKVHPVVSWLERVKLPVHQFTIDVQNGIFQIKMWIMKDIEKIPRTGLIRDTTAGMQVNQRDTSMEFKQPTIRDQSGQTHLRSRTFMFCESVINIANRSIPIPQPPVGGNPYSRAVQNVSSRAIASSSPDCRSWLHHEKIQ